VSDQHEDPDVERAINTVTRWEAVVDSFEHFISVTVRLSEHSTRYRLNLLWVHAIAAMLMAPLVFATGRTGLTGPSFNFLRTIPGAPYSLAILLGAGGTVLAMGCIFRAKRVEMAGLIGLLIFYLTLSVSFIIPPVHWLLHQDGTKPPLYGGVLYAHLTVIMGLHFIGLVVKRRDDAARSKPPER
jgi:hypothetical protein